MEREILNGKDFPQFLIDAVNAKQYSIAEQRLTEFLNNPVHTYVSVEGQVNALGYELLNAGRIEDAVEIFKLNTKIYPLSWNAYDSLGEAYVKAKKEALAIISYQKSLKLNPRNSSAAEALRTLLGK